VLPDSIVLDGAEVVEAVLREPGSAHGDGSTTSGYDEYFKRF
jgi:hypothetical protein